MYLQNTISYQCLVPTAEYNLDMIRRTIQDVTDNTTLNSRGVDIIIKSIGATDLSAELCIYRGCPL